MINFETAQKLKEHGFPQPECKTGQIWYNSQGVASFVGRRLVSGLDGHVYFYVMSLFSGRVEYMRPSTDDAFFAPTAADIMPLIDLPDFLVSMGSDEKFQARSYDIYDGEIEFEFENDDLDTCLAEVWLSQKADE